MRHGQNLDVAIDEPIDDDIWQSWHHEFECAWEDALATSSRKLRQLQDRGSEAIDDISSGRGIVVRYVEEDSFEIAKRPILPKNGHRSA